MTQGINQYKVGDIFEGCLLIKNATKGATTQGNAFLTLKLGDATGSLDAKFWNVTDDDIETYTGGTVVEIEANVIDYRGVTQLQLQKISISNKAKAMKPTDFMEKAPMSVEELREEINGTIFGMKNPIIRKITRAFIDRYDQEFFIYPAASSIHHAFISGLAYHTVSMLRVGKVLRALYPELNADRLDAGIILHDIGKIHEFVSASDTSRSLVGNLLGHIPIMVAEIREVANEMGIDKDCEEVMILQHLVLSHHGKPEWGSARTPLILEAEILHMIDNIDAKMNTMTQALSKTEPGAYTERMFSLDNRSFYKPLN